MVVDRASRTGQSVQVFELGRTSDRTVLGPFSRRRHIQFHAQVPVQVRTGECTAADLHPALVVVVDVLGAGEVRAWAQFAAPICNVQFSHY